MNPGRMVASLCVCFFISSVCHAQYFIWSTDSTTKSDPDYGMQRYHEVLRYHDPLMYLVFPVIKPVVERKIPLEDGEGKDGYWLEGQFGHRFSIYKGKYYSAPFWQRTRFTLDVALQSILTRDESSPILPFNNKVGLGLDMLISSPKNLMEEQSNILWTTLQFHHYSNGQADTFFVDAPVKRNNYKSGNFSTNYGRMLLSLATSKRNLFITSIGYQKEVDIGGPLGSSAELDKYYGEGRILFQLNWIKKPSLQTRNYPNRSNPERPLIQKEIRRQIGIRTELEYITGDLSNFPGEQKHRLGWHTYFTYMPSVTNEIGLMAHTYLGRHYLNMRFDDIVFAAGAGLYIKFNGR